MEFNPNQERAPRRRRQKRRRPTAMLASAQGCPRADYTANTNVPSDVCPVSKSIEAVFVSKTEARDQRRLGSQRNARYPAETCRPIACLMFVLPLLLAYELGSILLGHPSVRSGIDQWVHQFLAQLGLGGLVILPIATVAALLTLHHQKQDHWKIRPTFLVGMILEATGLGLILFWAANAIIQFAEGPSALTTVDSLVSPSAWWANIVACIGSGIYEELIFRIGLLSLLIFGASKLSSNKNYAALSGVIAVSLLFAALHYSLLNPAGNPFELSSFVFRFFASIVFCVLYLFRGFGIAVGVHVAYDVLTQF